MKYIPTPKLISLLHLEGKKLEIDVVEPMDGLLYGQLSLRLVQEAQANYWLASGPLEIKTLLDMNLIQEHNEKTT